MTAAVAASEGTPEANATIADARAIVSHIREGRGTVGAFVMDEEIYDDSDVRVELCTQPLSPATELLAMHEAGVLPRALATERALHSIGASRSERRGYTSRSQRTDV